MTDRPLVTARWLHDHLHDQDVRIVEASWHMPATGRNAQAEYETQHIPGAVFFDLDKHSSPSELPHMLPDSAQFAEVVGQLGISEQHRIVVYDSLGLFSAARIWWMFRHFGARQVWVLDGGLPAWLAAGFDVEGIVPVLEATEFNTAAPTFAAVNAEQVLQASESGYPLILDARSRARFLGQEEEARPGLRSGHIPGSHSMPFVELLDNGFMKTDAQLQAVLAGIGVSVDSSVITTCGSGVTAAIISLALECIGVRDVALYDGSWTEWGGLDAMPVATA